jgi:hypothetical protein
MRSVVEVLTIWAIMLLGFALCVWAWAANAQEADPPRKALFVLVVAYVGPDGSDKPRHHTEAFSDAEECLIEGNRLRAMWQGNGRIGDLATTCVQFNLAPWGRLHS